MFFNLKYLKAKYNMNISGIIHIGAHTMEEKDIYKSIDVNRVLWIDGMNCGIKHQDYLNYMIYDVEGWTDFHIMNHEQSSSLLPLDYHSFHYPNVKEVETKKVQTYRMDSVINNEDILMEYYNMLVLDIQGTEINAIRSFGEYLPKIDYIYTEINFAFLYKGCMLFDSMESELEKLGYKLLLYCKSSEQWGDALFERVK